MNINLNKFTKEFIKFGGLIVILLTVFNTGCLLYLYGFNPAIFGMILVLIGIGIIGLAFMTFLYNLVDELIW
jgi:hypothetical protein